MACKPQWLVHIGCEAKADQTALWLIKIGNLASEKPFFGFFFIQSSRWQKISLLKGLSNSGRQLLRKKDCSFCMAQGEKRTDI